MIGDLLGRKFQKLSQIYASRNKPSSIKVKDIKEIDIEELKKRKKWEL